MRRRWIADTECTSLTPDYQGGTGVIWELALLDPDSGEHHLWRMLPDTAKADPASLEVGHYWERAAGMCRQCEPGGAARDLVASQWAADPHWSGRLGVARAVGALLSGCTVICAVPTFDGPYLSDFLAWCGQPRQPWHFRMRDIGSIAYGYISACLALGVEGRDAVAGCPASDANTDDFARALGIDPGQFERHSALGGCRLVAAMLTVIEK